MKDPLLAATAPVALSSHAELHRQHSVAVALSRLLKASNPEALNEFQPPDELEGQLVEAEQLRCNIHLGDLESCKSQARCVAVGFAIASDETLREQERRLKEATECERQKFFNGLHDSLKRGDFASFAFQKDDYRAAFEAEKEVRRAESADLRARLAELESQSEPHLRRGLADCGTALSNFPRHTLGSPMAGGLTSTHIDALTMERGDDLWFAVEAKFGTAADAAAEQAVASVSGSCIPRDLLLVVDLSGSMCEILPVLQDCLQDIILQARTGDQVCLIGFSSRPQVLCDWIQLQSKESRQAVCDCIMAASAHGGTNLVPALDLAREQLCEAEERKQTASERAAAIVLLSDGDPEEPVDAILSASARLFATAPAVVPVALAVGEDSRPDIMALFAQSGRGASLYIANREQLPSQLGRMWGILGGGAGDACSELQLVNACAEGSGDGAVAATHQDYTAAGNLVDCFAILEAVEGAEVIEIERPPGGAVVLNGVGTGQNPIVLRCGQHVGRCRELQQFAARLRLPPWASAPVESSTLQRPLLRATWIWSHHGRVHSACDVLRVIQVPSLLVEAQLGLPLRIVLAADGCDCESFDRTAFVQALAAALGVEEAQLPLGRLSPGSIIADMQLLVANHPSVHTEHARTVLDSCSQHGPDALFAALAHMGYNAQKLLLPGKEALRRMLTWHLAQALESAAQDCTVEAQTMLDEVRVVASSAVAQAYDNNLDQTATSIQLDAETAMSDIESAGAGGLTPSVKHRLAQQAHAHVQQLCPELDPVALVVRRYEAPALRNAALSFQEKAASRETALPVPFLELAPPDCSVVTDHLTLCVRVSAAATCDILVTKFALTLSCGEQSMTHEILVPADGGANAGVLATLPALQANCDHSVVAAAGNGRIWGRTSEPLSILTKAQGDNPRSPSKISKKCASLTHARPRSLRRRSTSKAGPHVAVLEATPDNLGALALKWEVRGIAAPCSTWSVLVRVHKPQDVDPPEHSVHGLVECAACLTNLVPSTAYHFRISLDQPTEDLQANMQQPPAQPDPSGLCIQGISLMRRQPSIRTAEGVVIMPPLPATLLAELQADERLQPFGEGVFLTNSADIDVSTLEHGRLWRA